MRSSNPILNDRVLQNNYAVVDRPMTVSGTINKLFVLFFVMLLAAGAVYYQFTLQRFDFVNILMIAGVIVGFVSAIVVAFKQKYTPYIAPIYAFSQGAVLSGISCFMEAEFHGIVIQAVSMTFLVLFVMAFLYKIGAIKATEKFKSVILAATFAIFLFYLISFILFFFGHLPQYFTSNSNIAIVVNVAIAVVAALNLILDFDFIEKGTMMPLPSVYEWYGAFGLLVTIVWLYIEILRLLGRVRSR